MSGHHDGDAPVPGTGSSAKERIPLFPAENIRDWRGKDIVDDDADKIGSWRRCTSILAPTTRRSPP
jgi:hypothetical protein